MAALIDSDIIAYRCAASAENEPVDVAIMRVDNMIMEILGLETDYISFLSGKNNFRKEINPNYKANRKDIVRPQHLDSCRNYLVTEYNSIITDGYEADDALGFNLTEETVIYSIDKDLLMIPGHHYNFVKKEYREVSETDALRAFYRQMLIGDSSDNIQGVAGIGKVKAAKLIDPLETEEEMYSIVRKLYYPVPDCKLIEDEERFYMNADCLWIMRKEGERFSHRHEKTQMV